MVVEPMEHYTVFTIMGTFLFSVCALDAAWSEASTNSIQLRMDHGIGKFAMVRLSDAVNMIFRLETLNVACAEGEQRAFKYMFRENIKLAHYYKYYA